MTDFPLTITASQRDLLLRLLTSAQRGKRVEVRRTEFSHDLRDELETEEEEMQALIDKLTEFAHAT